MLRGKKDTDGGLSGLKYELSILRTEVHEMQEKQKDALETLRKQISKLASGKIVTPKAILEGIGFDVVPVEELDTYLETTNGQVIDVRTDAEWKQGRIEGSLHIPLHALEGRLGELSDKNQSFFLVCSTGDRALTACRIMLKKGFESVFHVEGGLGRYSGELVME